MKIGLILPPSLDASTLDLASRAEALGYDSVWLGEHVVLPMADRHDHPYGKVVIAPDTHCYAPFALLAAIAAVTQTLRVATGVILPSLRNVFATGREITTLDIISDGRLDVGVGVGWHPGEFELMGSDFAARGRYTDEFLDALERLLCDAEPSFKGRYISFEAVGFEPKPVQRPRPPILVGGDTSVALRRAAKRGDGWYGHAETPDQAYERIAILKALLEDEGRDPAGFQYVVQVWNPPDDPQAYFDAGVDRLVTMPFRDDVDPLEAIEAYAVNVARGSPAKILPA